MKYFFLLRTTLFVLLPAAACTLLNSCMKDSMTDHYTIYRPVYATVDDVKANIKSQPSVAIGQPGKTVLKDHFLFMNEVDKGIHVIDVADPAHPVNLAFIEIPGNVDLAVNGNYLYADCYTNLVTLDITDPGHVSLLQFLAGVFPPRYYSGIAIDQSKLIEGWVKVDTVVSNRLSGGFDNPFSGIVYMTAASYGSVAYSYSNLATSGIVLAGSLARFTISQTRLYTVGTVQLKSFNLARPDLPVYVSTTQVGMSDVQTIFPYNDKLFLGGVSGMYIYDVSNPDQPTLYGQFKHAKVCDPVIAEGKYAYITLSSGTVCQGYTNELDIVDLTALANPVQIKAFPLTNPKGLAKDGNLVLVCDGRDGLKIIDVSHADNPVWIKQVSGFESIDIIAWKGNAVVTAKDGIYFVDYSNPAQALVTSVIPFNRK